MAITNVYVTVSLSQNGYGDFTAIVVIVVVLWPFYNFHSQSWDDAEEY
jgi:hypothetical protein